MKCITSKYIISSTPGPTTVSALTCDTSSNQSLQATAYHYTVHKLATITYNYHTKLNQSQYLHSKLQCHSPLHCSHSSSSSSSPPIFIITTLYILEVETLQRGHNDNVYYNTLSHNFTPHMQTSTLHLTQHLMHTDTTVILYTTQAMFQTAANPHKMLAMHSYAHPLEVEPLHTDMTMHHT